MRDRSGTKERGWRWGGRRRDRVEAVLFRFTSIDMLALFKLPIRSWEHISVASDPHI